MPEKASEGADVFGGQTGPKIGLDFAADPAELARHGPKHLLRCRGRHGRVNPDIALFQSHMNGIGAERSTIGFFKANPNDIGDRRAGHEEIGEDLEIPGAGLCRKLPRRRLALRVAGAGRQGAESQRHGKPDAFKVRA